MPGIPGGRCRTSVAHRTAPDPPPATASERLFSTPSLRSRKPTPVELHTLTVNVHSWQQWRTDLDTTRHSSLPWGGQQTLTFTYVHVLWQPGPGQGALMRLLEHPAIFTVHAHEQAGLSYEEIKNCLSDADWACTYGHQICSCISPTIYRHWKKRQRPFCPGQGEVPTWKVKIHYCCWRPRQYYANGHKECKQGR